MKRRAANVATLPKRTPQQAKIAKINQPTKKLSTSGHLPAVLTASDIPPLDVPHSHFLQEHGFTCNETLDSGKGKSSSRMWDTRLVVPHSWSLFLFPFSWKPRSVNEYTNRLGKREDSLLKKNITLCIEGLFAESKDISLLIIVGDHPEIPRF